MTMSIVRAMTTVSPQSTRVPISDLFPSPVKYSCVCVCLCGAVVYTETWAEPSLQAKQLQLKRARLADDLNDKISHRPGPIELVHKNILPVPVNCLLGV